MAHVPQSEKFQFCRNSNFQEIPIFQKFQLFGNSNYLEIPIIQKFQKFGTSIAFDFMLIISMVLMIILSTIIAIVIILFELNWFIEYLIDLKLKMTHIRVTIDQVDIVTVFIIENIFVVNEIARIINDKQQTMKNSRLKSKIIIIKIEQLSCNINCNTAD